MFGRPSLEVRTARREDAVTIVNAEEYGRSVLDVWSRIVAPPAPLAQDRLASDGSQPRAGHPRSPAQGP